MSGAGDQSPVTGSQRLSGSSREAAGNRGGSEAPGFPGRGLPRRIVAAGIVVAVAACLSWAPVRGLTLGTSRPDRHTARLLAEPDGGGTSCSGVTALAGPGVHGSFTVPASPCDGYRPRLSSARPPGPGGYDIRLLAFRHRTVSEAAWSQRGSCVDPARIPRLAAAVIDPARHRANTELPADPVPEAERGQLGEMFSGPATLTCVAVGAGGQRPGSLAGTVGRWYGAFSGSGQVSCGDRAALPGRSPRYHVIWLVCGQCGTRWPCCSMTRATCPCAQDARTARWSSGHEAGRSGRAAC